MRPERRDESIDLDAFYARLLDPDLNAAHAAARAPTQDMTRPLSHYFISSR